jgi:hypothetical protein
MEFEKSDFLHNFVKRLHNSHIFRDVDPIMTGFPKSVILKTEKGKQHTSDLTGWLWSTR